jgi:hypothetical protein
MNLVPRLSLLRFAREPEKSAKAGPSTPEQPALDSRQLILFVER